MAKIDVLNNKMAMFMLCEAIGEDRKEWTDSIRAGENGFYEINIQFEGKEINVERFLQNLHRSYQEAVKKETARLLCAEYENLVWHLRQLQSPLEQGDLEQYDKLLKDMEEK